MPTRTAETIQTDLPHHAIGVIRVNQGFAIIDVGIPVATSATTDADTATTARRAEIDDRCAGTGWGDITFRDYDKVS